MRIYFVRHGRSMSNLAGTYSHPDTDLAPEAEKELLGAKEYLSRITFDKVFTSDLKRNVKTSEILGFPEAVHEPRLRERDFGIFVRSTHLEALERFPEEYDLYQRDPVDYRIPEGESFNDVCDRVWGFLDELTAHERSSAPKIEGFRPHAADPSNVLLIAHFNVIASAMCWVFENRYLSHHLVTENGGVLILDIRGPLKTIFLPSPKVK